jgi:hypothetical protein
VIAHGSEARIVQSVYWLGYGLDNHGYRVSCLIGKWTFFSFSALCTGGLDHSDHPFPPRARLRLVELYLNSPIHLQDAVLIIYAYQ